MRIHPLAVIFAIAAGVVLAGIIGGLIAVPTVAVLNAVGHHLLDDPEAAGGGPSGRGADRRARCWVRTQEEQAEEEAEDLEERAELASRERLDGES